MSWIKKKSLNNLNYINQLDVRCTSVFYMNIRNTVV